MDVLYMENQFTDLISRLSSKQLSIISETINILLIPFEEKRLYTSDEIFTEEIIDYMGDF